MAKLGQAAGDVRGRRAVVAAATGPVGLRAAGLLAHAGADVSATSRRPQHGALAERIRERWGAVVKESVLSDTSQAAATLEGDELLLTAGAAGVCLIPRDAWLELVTLGESGMEAVAARRSVVRIAAPPVTSA